MNYNTSSRCKTFLSGRIPADFFPSRVVPCSRGDTMKIFVSHSSRQKWFVDAIKKRLPPFVNLWVDEHELLIGDEIETRLEEAISNQCDLVLLIVDRDATQSEWVKREVEWAIHREEELARPYLLPIVLDRDALQHFDETLRKRKHLVCLETSRDGLDRFGDVLVRELFGWLVRERAPKSFPSPLQALDTANVLASSLAVKVRTIVHAHRRDNPLPIDDLAAQLRQDSAFAWMDVDAARDLLRRLRSSHMLGGIFNDRDYVYLAQERNVYKRTLFAPAKRAIARTAAQMVQSSYRIGIDGGSTTLELATYLADELRAQSVTDIEVFTNSVQVAYLLLEMLSQLEAGDHDTLCRVILTGGWCRPTSLTVVPLAGNSMAHEGHYVCPQPLRLDVAFLGTNGLHGSDGFAIAHDYEVPAKRALIEAAQRKVFLVDPSKFEVQQEVLFAPFDEGYEIITAHIDQYAASIERTRKMLEGTPTTMEVVSFHE